MAWREKRLRVSLAGATGYAGAGCLRLLSGHPAVELTEIASRSQPGRVHADVYPGSECRMEMVESVDGAGCDVVISALPHGEAARSTPAWLAGGAVVLDVSADFRLSSAASFQRWYGSSHPSPELLAEAVLALPELRPAQILNARILALPGCFSTAAILACGPAAARRLVEPEVVIDGKTGVSGAGRGAGTEYLFSELDESVKPYAVGGHRHQPEMEQVLGELFGSPFAVTFVPHLVPMTRGIEVTCYLRLRPGVTLDQLRAEYRSQYRDQPFVRVSDAPVPSKQTSHTNLCWISLAQQGRHLVVAAVLDNLGRGASSQAIQVMNMRFGLEPTAGIASLPQWP
jgi:N-acetyl-gamma-glutamyl-phosphate reductase